MAQRFKRFDLQPLMGAHQLVLNTEQAILSSLLDGELVEQQRLTDNEMYVVEELLNTYPEYCPSEILISAMTGQSLEKCQEKVLWAQEEGASDVVMRPIRNLLGYCRLKLHPFGIEIKSLTKVGYVLIPLQRTVRMQAVAAS
jgi:hypothetical protein